jgi:hypothetical protein
MVDYVRLEINDIENIGQVKRKQTFRESCWSDTYELRYPLIKKLGPITLTISYNKITEKETLYVEGSLHKYYNFKEKGIETNCDRFGFKRLEKSVEYLEAIGFDIRKARVKSMEIGLNINCGDSDPNHFVKCADLFYYKKYNVNMPMPNNGLQKLFIRDSYSLKLYNKSAESRDYLAENENILRIEIKLRDHQYCMKELNVKNLEDLLYRDSQENMINLFLKHWQNMLMMDSLEATHQMIKSDFDFFEKYNTLEFFEYEKDPKKKRRIYDKFIRIADQYHYRKNYLRLVELINQEMNAIEVQKLYRRSFPESL